MEKKIHSSLFKENRKSILLLGETSRILDIFPPKSIQTIITSPPYWGLRDYGYDDQIGLESSIEEYFSKLLYIFKKLMRVLQDTGTLWLIVGDTYTSGNRKYRAVDNKYGARKLKIRPDNPPGLKNKNLIGIPWKLAFELQSLGWHLRCDIIWSKPNPMPESVKDRPNRNHEYIFLFSKNQRYFFNKNALISKNGKKLRSVWEISRTNYNYKHYATFPTDLVSPCILSSSREEDCVLDPFCGVGTVGVVCKEFNRKFIGIDLNKEFLEEAKNFTEFEIVCPDICTKANTKRSPIKRVVKGENTPLIR